MFTLITLFGNIMVCLPSVKLLCRSLFPNPRISFIVLDLLDAFTTNAVVGCVIVNLLVSGVQHGKNKNQWF